MPRKEWFAKDFRTPSSLSFDLNLNKDCVILKNGDHARHEVEKFGLGLGLAFKGKRSCCNSLNCCALTLKTILNELEETQDFFLQEARYDPSICCPSGVLGILVDDSLCVIEVIPCSPASECGKIFVGDVLCEIDGHSVWSSTHTKEQVAALLAGSEGTYVHLRFQRCHDNLAGSDVVEVITILLCRISPRRLNFELCAAVDEPLEIENEESQCNCSCKFYSELRSLLLSIRCLRRLASLVAVDRSQEEAAMKARALDVARLWSEAQCTASAANKERATVRHAARRIARERSCELKDLNCAVAAAELALAGLENMIPLAPMVLLDGVSVDSALVHRNLGRGSFLEPWKLSKLLRFLDGRRRWRELACHLGDWICWCCRRRVRRVTLRRAVAHRSLAVLMRVLRAWRSARALMEFVPVVSRKGRWTILCCFAAWRQAWVNGNGEMELVQSRWSNYLRSGTRPGMGEFVCSWAALARANADLVNCAARRADRQTIGATWTAWVRRWRTGLMVGAAKFDSAGLCRLVVQRRLTTLGAVVEAWSCAVLPTCAESRRVLFVRRELQAAFGAWRRRWAEAFGARSRLQVQNVARLRWVAAMTSRRLTWVLGAWYCAAGEAARRADCAASLVARRAKASLRQIFIYWFDTVVASASASAPFRPVLPAVVHAIRQRHVLSASGSDAVLLASVLGSWQRGCHVGSCGGLGGEVWLAGAVGLEAGRAEAKAAAAHAAVAAVALIERRRRAATAVLALSKWVGLAEAAAARRQWVSLRAARVGALALAAATRAWSDRVLARKPGSSSPRLSMAGATTTGERGGGSDLLRRRCVEARRRSLGRPGRGSPVPGRGSPVPGQTAALASAAPENGRAHGPGSRKGSGEGDTAAEASSAETLAGGWDGEAAAAAAAAAAVTAAEVAISVSSGATQWVGPLVVAKTGLVRGGGGGPKLACFLRAPEGAVAAEAFCDDEVAAATKLAGVRGLVRAADVAVCRVLEGLVRRWAP